jgi:hypothetical protein
VITIKAAYSAELSACKPGPVVARLLWEIAEEISSQVPLEEWAKLPTDGAEQHDRYLYGVAEEVTRIREA